MYITSKLWNLEVPGSASELIVLMHYMGMLLELPCLRVTFCCIILDKYRYTCADTQLPTPTSYVLLILWSRFFLFFTSTIIGHNIGRDEQVCQTAIQGSLAEITNQRFSLKYQYHDQPDSNWEIRHGHQSPLTSSVRTWGSSYCWVSPPYQITERRMNFFTTCLWQMQSLEIGFLKSIDLRILETTRAYLDLNILLDPASLVPFWPTWANVVQHFTQWDRTLILKQWFYSRKGHHLAVHA